MSSEVLYTFTLILLELEKLLLELITGGSFPKAFLHCFHDSFYWCIETYKTNSFTSLSPH